MRKFEDLKIGDTGQSSVHTVELADMLTWAREYDPQWFHLDPEAAKNSIFGEVVAPGIYTAALWRKLDHEINEDIDFICGIAWKETRWPNALRAGDKIYATSEIVAKRRSKGQSDRGVVTFRYGLRNQHDALVFSCDSINLVRRRGGD
jgi:acyl dehydratase